MRVGYLVSSFDMLSVGDLSVIDQARQLCDQLVVGVLSTRRWSALSVGHPSLRSTSGSISSPTSAVSAAQFLHARDTAIEADSVFVCAVHQSLGGAD